MKTIIFALLLIVTTATAHSQSGKVLDLKELILIEESTESLSSKAEAGDVEAQAAVGMRYLNGHGNERNPVLGVRWLEKAAEQGHSDAMWTLGNIYYFGADGIKADRAKALQWYENAAMRGHSEAAYRRGRLGQPHDSLNWFLMAAKEGHAEAQYEVGMAYFGSPYMPPNHAETVKWLRLASQQRHNGAAYFLGLMYQSGDGVPQDFKEAFALFRAAAQRGDIDAELAMGKAFAEGRGIPRDYAAAMNIFRRLANRSQVEAFAELALSYANGRGVAKSPVVAYSIYNFAATKFPHAAPKLRGYREKVLTVLRETDIEAGQQLTQKMLEAPDFLLVIDEFTLQQSSLKRKDKAALRM